MPLLALKLLLTPLIVGGASWAARRWGPSVGGWLVSLPLVSGPVILFLALEQGTAFASQAAAATLAGFGVVAGWSLGYVAARSRGPFVAVVASGAVFAGIGLAVQPVLGAPFLLLAAGSLVAVVVALRILPADRSERPTIPHPRWDLPARVVAATALVVGLTTVAPLLGPELSGLLSTYPVYLSVLAVFTQLRAGPAGAVDVIRGLLTGLFGTIAFYVVLHPLLVPAGVGPAFVAAILVTLAVQGVALRRVRAASRLKEGRLGWR